MPGGSAAGRCRREPDGHSLPDRVGDPFSWSKPEQGCGAMTVLMVIGKAALWFAIPLALAGFELYRLKREERRDAEQAED
jgi:hypothetical protein